MKILYHSPCHQGGLSEYAVHQGRALAAVEGVELFWQSPANVVSPQGATALAALPTPEVRPGRSRFRRGRDFLSWILSTNRALNQAITEVKADAVLLPGWSEYFSPLWAWRLRSWRRRGVRFGAIIHDPVRDFARGGQTLHRLSLQQAYSFLDVAFVHESQNLDTAGAAQPRTIVIPMGPYPVTDGEATKPELRRELGIPELVKVFLSFGHIRDGKCLDVVLEAMVRCPDCHLVVAGREQSGGQKPASFYQELASRLGVSDRCHWFIDHIPNEEVWRYFRAADALLLLYSKDFYSMSAVLNVNVQFRLPVLASAGGGPLLKAVESYGLGIVIHDTNPATIASAIAENRQPIARWDDYVSDHSWETNATRVIEALSQASSHAR